MKFLHTQPHANKMNMGLVEKIISYKLIDCSLTPALTSQDIRNSTWFLRAARLDLIVTLPAESTLVG